MKTSMRFDLVDLRLFLFVVEAASITHGAGRAGMALASASERIRLMEESLGAPLLEHVAHAELAADLFHLNRLALVCEARIAGDHEQPADAGERSDDLVALLVKLRLLAWCFKLSQL